MENKNWIKNILVSLFVFIVQIFTMGVRSKEEFFYGLRRYNEDYLSHPARIAWALLAGLFVGFIFWLIQYLGKNMPKSGFALYARAFEIALFLIVFLWSIINLFDVIYFRK